MKWAKRCRLPLLLWILLLAGCAAEKPAALPPTADTLLSATPTAFETEERILALTVTANGKTADFTAVLANNSSAEALWELLGEGPLTVEAEDYGGFEKVGDLQRELPKNDAQITTEPGDLILYRGSAFVLYYGVNSWSFTRLGKLQNVTEAALKEALGAGSVTITLSRGE